MWTDAHFPEVKWLEPEGDYTSKQCRGREWWNSTSGMLNYAQELYHFILKMEEPYSSEILVSTYKKWLPQPRSSLSHHSASLVHAPCWSKAVLPDHYTASVHITNWEVGCPILAEVWGPNEGDPKLVGCGTMWPAEEFLALLRNHSLTA
jgi:hypothetical protein